MSLNKNCCGITYREVKNLSSVVEHIKISRKISRQNIKKMVSVVVILSLILSFISMSIISTPLHADQISKENSVVKTVNQLQKEEEKKQSKKKKIIIATSIIGGVLAAVAITTVAIIVGKMIYNNKRSHKSISPVPSSSETGQSSSETGQSSDAVTKYPHLKPSKLENAPGNNQYRIEVFNESTLRANSEPVDGVKVQRCGGVQSKVYRLVDDNMPVGQGYLANTADVNTDTEISQDIANLQLRPGHLPEIIMLQCGTVEAMRTLKEQKILQDQKAVVLVFGDSSRPGGQVENGTNAQEEAVTRRGDLKTHLESKISTYYIHNAGYNKKGKTPDERLGTTRILYTPGVRLFPNATDTIYVNAIVASAPDLNPKRYGNACRGDLTNPWYRTSPNTVNRMANIIKGIVAVAGMTGNDIPILGAFGCGSFGNDARTVAEQFALKLKGAPFERVVFAIPPDTQTTIDFQGGSNFNIFRDILVKHGYSINFVGPS